MKKIKITKPKIIKTTKYKTIDFVFIYPIKFQKANFFDLKIIRNIITSTSLEYPLEKDFRREALRNLIINYNIEIVRIKNSIYFKVYLTIPNPKDVVEFNLERAFDFFFNALYKPNVVDKAFNEQNFTREKDFLVSKCKNTIKDIYGYSYENFMKSIDSDYYNKFSDYANLDIMDKTTAKSVYEYYEENIYNNQPIVFVYGNILEKEVAKLLKKYFSYNMDPIINKDYLCYKKSNSKVVEVIDKKKEYQDSILDVAFTVENMQKDDEIYLIVLNNVISKSLGVSLFFKKLRLDNNLVYSVYNYTKLDRGLFIVETSLEKNNKDKALELIKETMEELKDCEVLKKYQKKCLRCMHYIEIRKHDDKYFKLDEEINNYLGIFMRQKELFLKFKEIDVVSFRKFLDRVKLDTIYFLRGEK